MTTKLKSYFNPKSLSWWGGAGLVLIGCAQAAGYNPVGIDTAGVVLASLLGGNSMAPAGYILLGLAVIGIRGKQERG